MIDLIVNSRLALKNVEMIIFDKEGTLVDIHHYWGSMIKLRANLIINQWFKTSPHKDIVFEELISAMGINHKTGFIKPCGPVGIKSRVFIVEVVREYLNSLDVKVNNNDVEKIFCEVDKNTENNISSLLKLLPGVKYFLDRCLDTDVKMIIISTDITRRIQKAIDALSLSGYFTQIIGRDQVTIGKPAPEAASLALEKANQSPERVASIGDHPVDIEMGVKASIACNIGMLTGLGDISQFLSQPCLLAKSFHELELNPN